jgi:hypothetical protein
LSWALQPPATLAGRLPPASHRGFRIRVVTRGISNGSVAAFRHRRRSARSSPARTSQPALRPATRCPEGRSLVPRNALRRHPGFEVSLAFSLNPAPHGFRFGVQAFPAVPTHVTKFYPSEPESACASYPALLRPAYRYAERVATSSPNLSARVVRLPPLRASGCARAALRYFPQVSAGTFLCAPVVGRFLLILSGWSPCGFQPAVRNPLPSPRASSHFRASTDLSKPTYSYICMA